MLESSRSLNVQINSEPICSIQRFCYFGIENELLGSVSDLLFFIVFQNERKHVVSIHFGNSEANFTDLLKCIK